MHSPRSPLPPPGRAGLAAALVTLVACSHDTLSEVPQGPEVLQPLLPLDGACVAETATPRLEWTKVAGARSYSLVVATDAELGSPVCSLDDLTQPGAVCPQPFAPGRYFWRVRAHSARWGTLASTVQSFVVSFGVSAASLAPLPSPLCTTAVELSWTDPGAGAPGVSYQVQVSAAADFSSPIVDAGAVDGTTWTVEPALETGTYWVRLRKHLYQCPVGDWASQSFSRAEPRPKPTGLRAQWSGCGPYDILLSWEGTAPRYEIEVTSDQGFVSTVTVEGTQVSLQALVPATYTWRVRDALASCAGDWAAGDVLHLGAGRDWAEVVPATPLFSPREGHGAVVAADGNTLWVFAGETSGDANDVWSTPDGVSWTLLTPAAEFSKRRWFATAFFLNRVWLLGGNVGASSLNFGDVWSSADGVAWTLETEGAFAARHSPAAVVFDDRLWVIGGEGPANCTSRADVWSSSDGVMWIQETADGGFPGRDWHASVVFDGRLWIIGGINRDVACTSEYLDDVWASADGRLWELVADGPFAARAGHTAVVFDGKIWVIGGTHAWPAASQSDVWYSADGVNWCEATGTTEFSSRYGHASVAFQDGLWVIGGFDQTSVHAGFQDDLWVSR
jgi:hypothetical protein